MKKTKRIFHKFHIVQGASFLIIIVVLLTAFNLRQEKKDYIEAGGEIVVIFNEEIGDNTLLQLAEEYGASVEIRNHIEDYSLLFVNSASKFNNVLNRLQEEPLVLAAQANTKVSLLNFNNDPYTDSQWYIDNPWQDKKLSEQIDEIDMDVTEAWELEKVVPKKREVVVAVIDTGVDYKHPDLAKNMWVNKGEVVGDNIDNDNNGYVDDIYGWDFLNNDNTVCHYQYSQKLKLNVSSTLDNDDHGTHVAGIIGAVANNNIGIAGVASNINIKIMALKINGGKDGSGSISGAIEAIKYATMMGADICNLSWGTDKYTAGLKQVIKEADMLFVAAAGNTGDNNDSDPIYPASLRLDNMISVTFIDSKGRLTGYANYGIDTVDLAAPGEDIYSTVVGTYLSMSGSSMAAPQVSAVASMLYAYSDNLYPANVKNIITSNIKPMLSLVDYVIYPGIPSAYHVMMAGNNLKQDTEMPVLTFETKYKKGTMTVPISAKDLGNSKIRAIKWLYGKNKLEDFLHGVNGTLVENNQISVAKAGLYTFYASDYAGNETIQTYNVIEDTLLPKITTTYIVSDNYKHRTVTVKASDLQSGVKRVKYMAGIRKAKDFLPAGSGTELILKNGISKFEIKRDGTYTIFASDNRGNLTVQPIIIRTIKTTDFKLLYRNKTMQVGDLFNLRATIRPTNSTDRITYSSSNQKVAIVNSSGSITALAQGKAFITAKTSSGLTSQCVVTIDLK